MSTDLRTDVASGPPPDPSPTPPRRRARRGRRLAVIGAAAAVLVGVAAVVLVVFQPQKLIFDDHVDEALPGLVVTAGADEAPADAPSAAPAGDGGAEATVPAEPAAPAEPAPPAEAAVPADPEAAALAEAARTGAPVAFRSGAFTSLDHTTTGTAYVVAQPDGSRLLRIEDLETENGPDLHVVLSTAEVGTGDYADLIDLGGLKGNIGSQNYELPADLDLGSVRSVLVWCERFSAPFGEAPLVG